MTSDKFIEALRSLVQRCLNDRDFIDFTALYPAKVVAQDGVEVDVAFDDPRLNTKNGIPLAVAPGAQVTLRPGTRVLVGWAEGDERKPRAHMMWEGEGGVLVYRQDATELDLVGTVNLGGAPGGTTLLVPVMLATPTIQAQTAMFGAMSAAFTAVGAVFTALGAALPPVAPAAGAAATACAAAATAIGTYNGQTAKFAATKVNAT